MKAVAAMLLLLALVVAAANGDHDGHHHDHHRGHGGHSWRDSADDNGGHRRSSGLSQCVTVCGSRVTSCMLDCYMQLIGLDPVALPVCLVKCTNDAMVCASRCPVTGNA